MCVNWTHFNFFWTTKNIHLNMRNVDTSINLTEFDWTGTQGTHLSEKNESIFPLWVLNDREKALAQFNAKFVWWNSKILLHGVDLLWKYLFATVSIPQLACGKFGKCICNYALYKRTDFSDVKHSIHFTWTEHHIPIIIMVSNFIKSESKFSFFFLLEIQSMEYAFMQ